MLGPGCICINMQVTVPVMPSGASYGGGVSYSLPPPSGGPFTPVESPIDTALSGNTTVCGQTVSKTNVAFPGFTTPTTGETHFQGRIFNLTTQAYVPKANYVMQWWSGPVPIQCATNVPGAAYPYDKKFAFQAGTYYTVWAHFKPANVPASSSHSFRLEGTWTW